MTRRIFAVVALGLFTALAFGAEVSTPQSICNRFFDMLLNSKNAEAIDYFMGLNPSTKSKVDQTRDMKDLLAKAVQVYGAPIGVEEVSIEDITPSLQRRVYLTKHASHPLIWEMYFYKAKDVWLPDQLLFADQYQMLGRKK